MNRSVDCNTLLANAYIIKNWYNTGDINLQLGAVNTQEVKSISFHSRKLAGPQKRYTVTEK